jgi:alpha-L-fucosidase
MSFKNLCIYEKKIISLLLIVGQSCFLYAQNNDVQIIIGNQIGIKPLPVRKVRTEPGITHPPNEKLNWLIEARFGMFIHWGLFSGVGKGEWYMENSGTSPEEYRKLAYPQSSDQYFDASQFNVGDWAKLAKDAGMRYMNMVTQHHDGYVSII